MKFNKFNLITALLYVLGFVFVLLNFVTEWFNLVAMALMLGASVMLTISFYFSCKRKNAILSADSEEVVMEMALSEETESYVPVKKKKSKFKNGIENIRIFSPCILSGLLSLMFVAMLVIVLVKIF